jgi:hypothetical protein
LRDVEARKIRVESVESTRPSPFAQSLLFNFVGNFIYEGDAPLAERRAQALALDHTQLRELLGGAELRELLDGDVIAEVALELQRLAEPSIRHIDAVHDTLLSLGDLSEVELWGRCDHSLVGREQLVEWLEQLASTRRIIAVRIAGEVRYAAAEDAGRLRDALGVNPPGGLPIAFLDPVTDPLGDIISRFARTHGPFSTAQAARRFGLGETPVRDALVRLRDASRVVEGEFTPAAAATNGATQGCSARSNGGRLPGCENRSRPCLSRPTRGSCRPGMASRGLVEGWTGCSTPSSNCKGRLWWRACSSERSFQRESPIISPAFSTSSSSLRDRLARGREPGRHGRPDRPLSGRPVSAVGPPGP